MSTKKRLYYVKTAGYDMVISVELEDDHHIFYATECPSMEMPYTSDEDGKELAMQYLLAVEDDTSWDEDIQWSDDIDGKFDIDNFIDWFFDIDYDYDVPPDRIPEILAELDTEL